MMNHHVMTTRETLLHRLRTGKVLDIGCNWGEFHSAVERRFGPENVYGIDVQVTNYKRGVVRGNATTLPFKDETFDVVIAGELIEHIPQPLLLLREIERVLRRGGVISHNSKHPQFPLHLENHAWFQDPVTYG